MSLAPSPDMFSIKLVVGALCASVAASACTDETSGMRLATAPLPSASPSQCAPCADSTFSVTLPLTTPSPTPSPTPTPSPSPTPYQAKTSADADGDVAVVTDEELEQSLMTVAALTGEGRDCLQRGGSLSPADAMVRTAESVQLDVACDCGGVP